MNALDREWLMDMLEYGRAAIRILGSADASEVAADEQKFLALSYTIQIVGEAANRLSVEARDNLPSDIAWPKAVAMRHRLVHGYRTRSAQIVVRTVMEDIPALVAALERTLSEESG